MSTILRVEVGDRTNRAPTFFETEFPSAGIIYLPEAGDDIQFPGMTAPVRIKNCTFEYQNPENLIVWFNREN